MGVLSSNIRRNYVLIIQYKLYIQVFSFRNKEKRKIISLILFILFTRKYFLLVWRDHQSHAIKDFSSHEFYTWTRKHLSLHNAESLSAPIIWSFLSSYSYIQNAVTKWIPLTVNCIPTCIHGQLQLCHALISREKHRSLIVSLDLMLTSNFSPTICCVVDFYKIIPFFLKISWVKTVLEYFT